MEFSQAKSLIGMGLKVGYSQKNIGDIFIAKQIQGVLALCEFHYCEFHYCGFSKLLLKFG